MTQYKNKQQVDILGDLFRSSTNESPEGLEKLRELAYRKRPSTDIITESENYGEHQQKFEEKTQLKKELSCSISKRKVFEEGAPKVKIKIVIPKRIEHQISMSKIVDYAVESFMEELNSAIDE